MADGYPFAGSILLNLYLQMAAAGRDTLPVAAMCRVDLFLTHLVPNTLIDDGDQASNSRWYRPILTVLQSLSQLLIFQNTLFTSLL